MARHARNRCLLVAACLMLGCLSPARLAATAVHEAHDRQDAPACARTWVEHEEEIERYMRLAPIARIESLPIGVTRPKRAFFEPDGLVASVAWKILPPGRRAGYWESYKSEIAAYELDKLLGMHMVPPAVERTERGEAGAAVLWIGPVSAWNKDRPVQGPEPEWSRQVSRMKLFDQLIANIDRNQGNLLYDADWHLLLIDHSRAFTARASLAGIAEPALVDRWLWERIDALARGDVERALGPWIDGRAIEALFKRRDLMRRQIAARVQRLGERAVFIR